MFSSLLKIAVVMSSFVMMSQCLYVFNVEKSVDQISSTPAPESSSSSSSSLLPPDYAFSSFLYGLGAMVDDLES